MKYKRVNIELPFEIYNDWFINFKNHKPCFKYYEYPVKIDNVDFVVKFYNDDSKLLMKLLEKNKDKKPVLYYNSFKSMLDLITINFFEYKDTIYIFYLKIDSINIDNKISYLKKIGINPEVLERYIYSVDINDMEDIMDVLYCLLYTKFYLEYSSYENYIIKIDIAKFLLRKLIYNGYEVNDSYSLKDIHLLPATNKEEIFQKELEYLHFKLKDNDENDKIREAIRKKSHDLYEKFYSI